MDNKTKRRSWLDRLQRNNQALKSKLVDRGRNAVWACLVIALVSLIGLSIYLYLYLTVGLQQYQILAIATFAVMFMALVGAILARLGRSRLGVWIAYLTGLLSLFISVLLVSDQAIWYAVTVILTTLLISSLAMPQKDGIRAGLVAVTMALLILLVDGNFQIWQTAPPELLVYYLLGVVIFLFLAYFLSVGILFTDYSLRGKITMAVFSTAIVSILVVTTIYNQTYRVTLVDSANQSLLLAGERTASEIEAYLNSLIPEVEESASDSAASAYLNVPTEEREEADEVVSHFREMRQQLGAIELILLDRSGEVALHTSYTNVDQIENFVGLDALEQQSIGISLMTGLPYISSIIFPTPEQAPYQTSPYFYVGKQVLDADGNPTGMLLAAYPQSGIQEVVEANNDLAGGESYGVLVDDNYMRIANGAYPEMNYKLVLPVDEERINQLQQDQRLPNLTGETITTDYDEFVSGLELIPYTPFFEARESASGELNAAAGVRLGLKNWTLVYMQPRRIILLPVEQQNQDIILITALISGLAILISALLARLISNPITQLTQAAERASAGDLSLRAPASSTDEIGKMGLAFNIMIDQLQRTLQGLEQRVSERTAALTRSTEQLEYRASRLQMVAEVAETISTVSDPNQLLSLVVNTISERFGFYHVGVFMIDSYGEYAVLVAANSEGGQRMLARGHRLRVGQEGMVGFVTGRGQARIALDVGQDIVFFNNPDLPETRSEITLPLRVSDQLFGALDVQSTMPKAFDTSDIALLSTLANQVAIAIENARLIDEAQRSVRELELSQRLFIHQEWSKLLEEHTPEGFQYILGKLIPLSSKDMEGIGIVPKAPTVIFEHPSGNGGNEGVGLMVPITLRGETIGLIELGETINTRRWSNDEISLVSSIAEQVGLALEYARLLETTRRRAERERLVSEITTSLRATNDPQQILETAVTQLKHALRVQSVKVHVVSEAGGSEQDSNIGSQESDQQDPSS